MWKQRLVGLAASMAVIVVTVFVVEPAIVRLPLPFAPVIFVALVAIVGGLKLAYLLRARIDPSFDPAFGAHAGFAVPWARRR